MSPLHPGLVHFPISFLILSYGLDILHGFTSPASSLPAIPYLSSLIPSDIAPAALPALAHHLRTLTLATAVPAVLSGGQQLLVMTGGGKGWSERTSSGGSQLRPKIKVALLHAAVMDIAFGTTAWLWWREGGAGAAVGTFVLGDLQVLLGAVLLGVVMLGGKLGGDLTYQYGTGMNIASGKGKRA